MREDGRGQKFSADTCAELVLIVPGFRAVAAVACANEPIHEDEEDGHGTTAKEIIEEFKLNSLN